MNTQQRLQKRYQYLKVVLIDEVSMTDNGTFDRLNRWLRAINKKTDFDFGAVSVLTVDDLFPSMKSIVHIQKSDPNSGIILLCMNFVCQVVDPHFAQLLNRLREGNQTKKDIKVMEYTGVSTWLVDHVRLYLTFSGQ